MAKPKPLPKPFDPVTRDELLCNVRYKVVENENGERRIIQRLVADRNIFKCDKRVPLWDGSLKTHVPIKLTNAQLREMSAEELKAFMASTAPDKLTIQRKALDEAAAELACNFDEAHLEVALQKHNENLLRAGRRARTKVMDYVLSEYDFKYFVTLTLNGEHFARDDIKTANRKLQIWLNNKVQRSGLKYIIVPEYHKDGISIHYHGFINSALPLVESGTFIPPAGGRPIKLSTVQKKGYSLENCKIVYNIPSWEYGFSTAIALYGTPEAAAAYIGKYITKELDYADGDVNKIGGRYYYHSNNLRKPELIYAYADYDLVSGFEIASPICRFKVSTPYTEFCKTAMNTKK